jgi:hypothetical protein
MKFKKHIVLITAFLALLNYSVSACSMFVIKKNGKVMVGNNEDFWNQNSRMWFEKGNNDEFGVVYVGFDDLWPQGAINEKGLVFDGFGMSYLEINNFNDKKAPLKEDFLHYIMKTFSTVEEVKDFFSQRDLRGMETSMYYFVDKSGKQLIVEGDSIEIRNQSYDIISNFYPSQCDNLNDVTIKHYQKGRKLIETKQDSSVSFCTSLLDSLHQETSWGGGTLYSTLYDLNEGIIYLYYNHNFENVITFNVREELEKGNRVLEIPKLFPNNTKGLEFHQNYNEVISEINKLGHIGIISDSNQIADLEKYFLTIPKVNIYKEHFEKIAQQWQQENVLKFSIKTSEIIIKLFSDDYKIYYNLGENYFKLNQYKEALKYYQKCIEFVPENEKLRRKIEKIKELIK